MKNAIFTLMVVLMMCVDTAAQETIISQSKLKAAFGSSYFQTFYNKLLCKRWEFKFVFIGQTKHPKLPENKYFDILFNPNGDYQLIARDGQTESGNWKYDKSNKLVYLTSKTNINASIKSLSEDELIITMLSTERHRLKPNSQVHFRPYNY